MKMTTELKELYSIGRNERLASLLAEENIVVKFTRRDTAFFDVENRELYLPMWKGVDEHLLDMLIIHEVGHALYSEGLYYRGMNAQLKPYINIVDDVRVDRKQRIRFPGCKKDYFYGAKALLSSEINFFKLGSFDLKNSMFVDRVNIYSKVGMHISVPFNDEEKELLQEILECDTSEEVLEMATFLMERDKEEARKKEEEKRKEEEAKQKQEEQEPETSEETPEQGEMEEGESTEPEQSQIEQSEEDEEIEEDEDNSGDEGTSDEDDTGDDSEPEDDGSEDEPELELGGDIPTENDPDDETEPEIEVGGGLNEHEDEHLEEDESEEDEGDDGSGTGGGGGEEGLDSESFKFDGPVTGNALDELSRTLVDDNELAEPRYIDVGKLDPAEWVMDSKDVHRKINECNYFWKADIDFESQALKSEFSSVIEVMKKDFRVLRQAKVQTNYRTNKGRIDVNRLHLHQITDNIFSKTLETVSNAENHRMVFLIDYSISMKRENIAQLVKQLYVLREFCVSEGVPFDVYVFSSGDSDVQDDFMLCNVLNETDSDEYYFKLHIMLQGFKMHLVDVESGSTPLNTAVDVLYPVLEEIKRNMPEDKLNLILLTDGGATDCEGHDFVVDSRTGKQFAANDNGLHKAHTIFKIMRDREILHSIAWYNLSTYHHSLLPTTLEKTFDSSHLAVVKDLAGVDEIYFIKVLSNQRRRRFGYGNGRKANTTIKGDETVGQILRKMKIKNRSTNVAKVIAKSLSRVIA